MTEPLYLSDSKLSTTSALVTEVQPNYLILNQTIFYPQGGGQPSDKGKITSKAAELNVKAVEYNAGNIKHIGTTKGIFKIGDKVQLSIDQNLRLKHTQWHTAGHLIDLVSRQIYPELIPIRGMHGIGKKFFIEYEWVNDLDTQKIQSELNQLIKTKPIIKTQFVTLEELKKMSNWIPAKLPTSKKLRVLSIGDKYHIPDGGTQLTTNDPIWDIQIDQVEHSNNSTTIHYTVTEPTQKKSNGSIHRTINNDHDLKTQIAGINNTISQELQSVILPEQLDGVYLSYLGKKGQLQKLMSYLPKLSVSDKKIYGPMLNILKQSIKKQIEQKTLELEQQKAASQIDSTVPGHVKTTGHLHPTTTIIREMNHFFRYHGFSVQEGLELEDVEYNFRRLNLPEGHPATDLQDSLFIKEPQYLMRTHTSSVETRILSEYHDQLPLRVVVPGKCYRNETNSATNTSFFYQYQGFVVDKNITIQHLKGTLTKFHQFLFGHDVILRFRYKYYPEVSPGMGVDMQCKFCKGAGCSVCKYRGYIEVLGSGMIHYNTLKACGIDPDVYSGYAFGMGLDRLVMSKYAISDIRKLYGGELVYS